MINSFYALFVFFVFVLYFGSCSTFKSKELETKKDDQKKPVCDLKYLEGVRESIRKQVKEGENSVEVRGGDKILPRLFTIRYSLGDKTLIEFWVADEKTLDTDTVRYALQGSEVERKFSMDYEKVPLESSLLKEHVYDCRPEYVFLHKDLQYEIRNLRASRSTNHFLTCESQEHQKYLRKIGLEMVTKIWLKSQLGSAMKSALEEGKEMTPEAMKENMYYKQLSPTSFYDGVGLFPAIKDDLMVNFLNAYTSGDQPDSILSLLLEEVLDRCDKDFKDKFVIVSPATYVFQRSPMTIEEFTSAESDFEAEVKALPFPLDYLHVIDFEEPPAGQNLLPYALASQPPQVIYMYKEGTKKGLAEETVLVSYDFDFYLEQDSELSINGGYGYKIYRRRGAKPSYAAS